MPERGSSCIGDLLATCALPRPEGLLLLGAASGRSRERLIAGSGEPLTDAEVMAFRALADRRGRGEPIAYLVGHREFYGRRFAIGPDVLIPRPDTETLVELALACIDRREHRAPAPCRVLDLGTGSGVIAITLKLERPRIELVATDASIAALDVARDNAHRLGADIRWQVGDWYAALPTSEPPFDLIVANPPYIASDDRHLREGDLRFEPRVALTDGGDGLSALAAIARGARAHLTPGGRVAVEHGWTQAADVRALLRAGGLENAVSERDLAGIERVSHAVAGSPRDAAAAPIIRVGSEISKNP